MALRHLTDIEIQNYLDGNLSQPEKENLAQHLNTCPSCQRELDTYRNLYVELKKDIGINLSPNFSRLVMSNIQTESLNIFSIRFRDIFLSIVGLVIAVSFTLYFVDIKPLVKTFKEIIKPQINFSVSFYSSIKTYLAALNLDIHLFIFAGLILLILIVFDHLIYRHRDKLFSFLRILPLCCH